MRPLRPGDLLVLTFSGHGAQIPDVTGDEEDGLVLIDQTAYIIDKEASFSIPETQQLSCNFWEKKRVQEAPTLTYTPAVAEMEV